MGAEFRALGNFAKLVGAEFPALSHTLENLAKLAGAEFHTLENLANLVGAECHTLEKLAELVNKKKQHPFLNTDPVDKHQRGLWCSRLATGRGRGRGGGVGGGGEGVDPSLHFQMRGFTMCFVKTPSATWCLPKYVFRGGISEMSLFFTVLSCINSIRLARYHFAVKKLPRCQFDTIVCSTYHEDKGASNHTASRFSHFFSRCPLGCFSVFTPQIRSFTVLSRFCPLLLLGCCNYTLARAAETLPPVQVVT